MSRTTTPAIFAIGDVTRGEFADVAAWLQSHQAACFADCAAALAQLKQDWQSPAWIFFCTAQRGAIAPRAVERLHRAAPLAKLVHVCGSWCEGETRTGQALPGVARVAAHQFAARVEGALSPSHDYAGWTLPRGATGADVVLQRSGLRRSAKAPLVGVIAQARETYEALAEMLAACGAVPRWLRDPAAETEVRAVVCSDPHLHPSIDVNSRPHIVLRDFPRAREIELLLRGGFAAVVARPCLLGDLRHALTRAGVFARSASRQAG